MVRFRAEMIALIGLMLLLLLFAAVRMIGKNGVFPSQSR